VWAATLVRWVLLEDQFDHDALMAAMVGAEHATFALTHYPHPFYDESPMSVVGDYSSHRNVPNGEGRSVKAERLYLLASDPDKEQ
jgi:hypothetical protein